MSGTYEPIPDCPPSNPNKHVEKDGYRASFYPGFVSRLAVEDPAGGVVTELYRQETVFCLPPGKDKPWPSSTLEFVRPDGRRIALQIDDPDQQIGRIEVHLKSSAAVNPELLTRVARASGITLPDGDDMLQGYEDPPRETDLKLVMEDGPVLCPPICPGIIKT